MRYFCVILFVCGIFRANAFSGSIPNAVGHACRLHVCSHPYVAVLQTPDSGETSASRNACGWFTCGGIAAAHIAGAVAGYKGLTNLWGSPNGRFHFKDEIHDNLAFNDEVSHLFISYKFTQGFASAYRALGFSDSKARLLGSLEAAFVMTAVEFPIDAYNPTQGFGVTDLAADYIGIGVAWLRSSDPALSDFDLKTSVKSISAQSVRVLGDDASDYDRYIYWLTYRYEIAVIGAGYSTTRSTGNADPQLFLGFGTTVPDLVRPVSSKLADWLKPLELYFFNLNLRLL